MENKIEKGHCVWIYGNAKVGKTTTSYNLSQKKLRYYIKFDGDKFRQSRTPSLDFTREDILLNNREALRMIKFLTDEGWNIVVSMITPFKEMREEIKKELGDRVMLVELSCDIEIREKRKNYFKSDIEFESGGSYLYLDTGKGNENYVRDGILQCMTELEWIK